MIRTYDNKIINDFSLLKRTYKVTKICDSCGAKSNPQWRHAKDSQKKWGKDLCGSCSRSRDNQKIKTRYGRKIKAGIPGNYIMIWDDRRKRYVGEHHLVLEEMTGFDLLDFGWMIHHINGIKDDNSPTNLCAIPNNSIHRILHTRLEKVAFELVQRGVIHFCHDTCEYFIDPSVKLSTSPISLGFEDVAIVQKKSTIQSRSDINIKSEIIRDVEIDIPLIAANMNTVTNTEFCITLAKLGAIGVLHRASSDDLLEQWTKQIAQHNKWVAVSVGIGITQLELAKKLIRANANIIFIDVAHGYCNPVLDLGRNIKKFAPDVHIVVGNTVNPGLITESADFASAVKVGIAQGFACETKNTAGVTEKQFSAIQKCILASRTYGLPIISDGGIREPADFVKAIGGGASSVMAGKIFASCPESAAILNANGEKIYSGMASRSVQEKWRGKVSNDTPEGGTRYLPLGESVGNLLKRYSGSLRSGISYAGHSSVKEFRNNTDFIITQNTKERE